MASEPRVAGDASNATEVDGQAVDGVHDAMVDAPPDACIPATEVCNGIDDNCDGVKDDGLGLGALCDGNDNDACMEGTIVCGAGGSVVCSDVSSGAVELCNDVDDDCQNGIDDGFPVGTPCTVGLGACAASGHLQCDTPGTGTVCDVNPGAPSAEFCGNGIDEDCNGADAACPPNDVAAGAIDISAGGTWTVDLSTSHDNNWAASSAGFDCGDQGGRDAFYQFTLPADEVVYWDTFGSNFDSVVRVFAGACTGIGATAACSDDACSQTRSQGGANLAAGTYCLVVDQFGSTTTGGMASLVFRRGGRSGVALTGTSGTVTGTTTGKTHLSTASCEAQTSQPDVGHFFLSCPNRNYSVSANTCSGTAFDTVIYLRTGNATTSDKACSDDVSGCGSNLQSRITGATVSSANLQWIIVDGFGTTGNGNYSLTYSVQ